MRVDIHDTLSKCDQCRRVGATFQGAGDTLNPLQVPSLFYRWHLDFFKMPTSKRGYGRVLVTVEALTRYAILIPTEDKASATTAHAYHQHIHGMLGSAAEIVSDGGTEFQGEFDNLLHSLLRHINRPHAQQRIPPSIKWSRRTLSPAMQKGNAETGYVG